MKYRQVFAKVKGKHTKPLSEALDKIVADVYFDLKTDYDDVATKALTDSLLRVAIEMAMGLSMAKVEMIEKNLERQNIKAKGK